ncbi:MAG: type I-C CRISPR-associated protein Cas7/Csd2 [Tissierellia bacterium]|nr:type I-C CRISPR-associated protein Cas7/Csd2 [Tissierellia bacterium]
MKMINKKIDFVGIISVTNANPNGDPLTGNRPRENYEGYGEISDVCLKRKIRNRLQDMGEKIFVQMEERSDDGCNSLSDRMKNLVKGNKDKDEVSKMVCEEWIDVRSFGQVFAFKDKENMSLGVRGPVSIHSAFSVDPVDITSLQITKSVNSEPSDGKKSSDTMGMKHRVDFGIYLLKGSINCQLSEITGFNEEDAEKIKEAIRTIFDNDASSARPDGSMTMERLYWWTHNSKLGDYPSSKVHRQITVKKKENVDIPKSIEDYEVIEEKLPNLHLDYYEV